MNGTNVSNEVLARLTKDWAALTPEAQKAARYVLENPNDVGVSTVREIAEAANVKPNTFVRMARQVGSTAMMISARPSARRSARER